MQDHLRILTAIAALATLAISACSSNKALFPSCYGDETGCHLTEEGSNVFYQHENRSFRSQSARQNMCGQHLQFSQNQCGPMAVRWVAVPTYHQVFVENLRPAPQQAPQIVTPSPVATVEPYVPPIPYIEAEPYVPPTRYPSIGHRQDSYLPIRK